MERDTIISLGFQSGLIYLQKDWLSSFLWILQASPAHIQGKAGHSHFHKIETS